MEDGAMSFAKVLVLLPFSLQLLLPLFNLLKNPLPHLISFSLNETIHLSLNISWCSFFLLTYT
jgi:hypothetical protein